MQIVADDCDQCVELLREIEVQLAAAVHRGLMQFAAHGGSRRISLACRRRCVAKQRSQQPFAQGRAVQRSFEIEYRADVELLQQKGSRRADGQDQLRLRYPVNYFVEAIGGFRRRFGSD